MISSVFSICSLQCHMILQKSHNAGSCDTEDWSNGWWKFSFALQR